METFRVLAANFDDLRVLFLFYWIEACMIAYVGLGLINVKTDFRNILKVGMAHGFAVYLIRGIYVTLDIPFGTHTLILVMIMSFLISIFCRLNFGIALTGALLGVVTLVLGESLILPHFHKIINIPMEKVWANPWTHLLAGYVGDILLISTAVFIALTNFSLVRLRD